MEKGRHPKNTIATLMLGIVACALVFAGLRTEWGEWVLIVVGPVTGALLERRSGGSGLLGGVLGGVLANWAYEIVIYVRFYIDFTPDSVDLIGPFPFFLILTFRGILIGLVVGFLVRKIQEADALC